MFRFELGGTDAPPAAAAPPQRPRMITWERRDLEETVRRLTILRAKAREIHQQVNAVPDADSRWALKSFAVLTAGVATRALEALEPLLGPESIATLGAATDAHTQLKRIRREIHELEAAAARPVFWAGFDGSSSTTPFTLSRRGRDDRA